MTDQKHKKLLAYIVCFCKCLVTQSPTNQSSKISWFFQIISSTIRKPKSSGHSKFSKKTFRFWRPGNKRYETQTIIIFICPFPHEKINQCLTDINQYIPNIENQFYKVLLEYQLSVCLYQLHWLNIGLYRSLP